MQQRIERTGRTLEEARQRALDELGASPSEVRIEVVSEARAGLFGFLGSRPARVRAERLVRRHADVRELVIDLLQTMEIPADVDAEDRGGILRIGIRTQGLDGLLIGRRGQTLTALQHLVSRLASKEFGIRGPVEIDVGSYRARRTVQLAEKARALAMKVKSTGRETSLEPLQAPDRRVVHRALAGVRGVRTYTVGQGLHRSIVIAPESRSS